MDQRNRATGWQHAKLSGHSNEEAIKMLLSQDINEQKLFLSRLGKNNATITNIDVGGLNERDVKRAISLFWGSAEDTLDIVEKHSSEKIKAYEKRKHRLVADSILKYDEHLYHILISWFVENSYEIADFCFSKGLAKNQKDWANWIWYKNLIGEHEVDKLFSIESICAPIEKSQNMKPITAIVEAELPYSFPLVLSNGIKVKCSFIIVLIKSII